MALYGKWEKVVTSPYPLAHPWMKVQQAKFIIFVLRFQHRDVCELAWFWSGESAQCLSVSAILLLTFLVLFETCGSALRVHLGTPIWTRADVLVVAVFISPDCLLLGSLAQIMGVVSHGKCKWRQFNSVQISPPSLLLLNRYTTHILLIQSGSDWVWISEQEHRFWCAMVDEDF